MTQQFVWLESNSDTRAKVQRAICIGLFIVEMFIFLAPLDGYLALRLCRKLLYPHNGVLFSCKRVKKFYMHCYGVK